jgi:trk system potassium uptake protein TrkH
MNYISILNILGWMTTIEGAFMLLPAGVALCYGEAEGIWFVICGLLSALIGLVLIRIKRKSSHFYAREGNVAVALGWIVLSLIGALPFYLSGAIPSYVDALFEIISGFTTTGASILTDVEALSHCMLFWRSFSHWLGGMGVLVFAMTIMPLADSGSSFAMIQAESTGPSVSKLVPHLRETARNLYTIYLGLTVAETALLILGGQSLFEALCYSFGTVGTGGFGLLNSSLGSFSTYIQVVVTVFMVLSGINFQFFFLLILRQFSTAVRMEEVRWYLGIFGGTTVAIALNLTLTQGGNFFYQLQQSAFQTASIMTTTGYSTCNYETWPMFSKTLLLLLMFVGACAGSTGGGMKVCRILIYVKAGVREARRVIHPRQVSAILLDGKALDRKVVQGASMFLVCYLMIYVVSMVVISFDCQDMTTCFTAVAATINNIGPGFGAVGPAENFAFFSPLSKLVLSFDMLAGRLEVFPMLLLCFPSTWRK